MATRKRKQKQTLKEFNAWLQGVEELQPEGWSPTAEQWQLIRNKIDGIVEEKKVVEKVINDLQPKPVRNYQQGQNIPMIPAAPAVGGIPPAPVDMTPAARQMLNPAGEAAKTPDIDTSDGNVASSFV